MILDIDSGNTRLKWRLRTTEGKVIQQGIQASQVIVSGDLAESIKESDVSLVRLASVASEDDIAEKKSILEQISHAPVQVVKTMSLGSIKVAYDKPSSMGVDRWLAMLAAYEHAKQAVMVIDCGTALTMDLVDPDGLHKGGYIIPGYHLMRQSLSLSTGQVRFDTKNNAADIKPGVSTLEAVNSGALVALVGAIVHTYGQAEKNQPGVKVFLTGGDAERLSGYLPFSFSLNPDLVLDGLWRADSFLREFG